MDISGILLDTKRFAVHDGPGIRTAFFTKGCPLRCLWCHNPESTVSRPQMGCYSDLCRHCGTCMDHCPSGAQSMAFGEHRFQVQLCHVCGKCESLCPGGAMKRYGRKTTVAEALQLALEDRDFYEESGGGITVSGGEPLMQKEFTLALLREVRKMGIHTALDTCAFVPQSILAEALEVCDMFLVDFKHADPEQHRKLTGQPNELIKSNLEFLSDRGARIEVRIPFVPGCNDSPENMAATGAFLGNLRIECVKLLPYHALARNKYTALQMPDTMPHCPEPTDEMLSDAAAILRQYGIHARSGRE